MTNVLNIQIASRTGVGARSRNEDDLRTGVREPLAFAVLSDGAGGHSDGAVASDLVVRVVTAALQSEAGLEPRMLHATVRNAHELLLKHQSGAGDRERMHATLVALWIDAERALAIWSHVGDSRLYLLRGGRVLHVTRDDSAVQEMVDAGLLTAEAARRHQMKNQLLCAMGAESLFCAHTIEKAFPLVDGDAFLLCTDGWWDKVPHEEIERTLVEAYTPELWLAAMESLIQAGADPDQDNHTAIAIWVGEMPTRRSPRRPLASSA